MLDPPADHHILVFWVQLILLVGVARVLGHAMRIVGQPPVIGELAAGLVLGPSVLGKLAPGVFDWLFPNDPVQTAMLFTVGWLGVVFLLLVTGAETDLALVRRLGGAAVSVSTGSLVLPLALGFAVGVAIPARFIGDGDRMVFALFMAAALSISSLPVIAKILSDMGFMRRNFGQITLAAGMANDVVGWVLLGVIAGLAQAGEIAPGPVLVTVLGVAAFFVFALTAGQAAIDAVLRALRRTQSDAVAGTVAVLLATVSMAVITQWLGVEAVLGAFVAGVVLGRSKVRDEQLLRHVEVPTTAFFAPVFFATAGLRVDLGLLADPTVLLWGVIVVGVASLSKFAGAFVGAAAARLPHRERAALGLGLNARGALEIVIATVGLRLGVLNQAAYTVVVLMAMATSMMAPPMLRAVLRGWRGTEEERQRLEREETSRQNLVVRGGRLLLPSQGEPSSIVAAQVLDLAWPVESEVTVLTVDTAGNVGAGIDDGSDGRGGPRSVQPVLDIFGERAVTHQQVSGIPALDAILDEARLRYDAVGIGLSDEPQRRHHGALLSPLVAEVLQHSPVPVVMVRRARGLGRATPPAFARALVPVAGTPSSRAAQELALTMSARIGTEVLLTHVARQTESSGRAPVMSRLLGRDARAMATMVAVRDDVTTRLLDQSLAIAEKVGARARTAIRTGTSTAAELLGAAEEEDVDVVVLGTVRRSADGSVFLGQIVEHVLEDCDATVVVVVMPGEGAADVDRRQE